MVQSVKKWKHYLMGKETIIHTNHQPLQYLKLQTNLHKSRHLRWMGFLHQFHLVIRPIINVATLLKNNFFFHECNVEKYEFDNDFQDVYENLIQGKKVEELDYHVHNNMLYHLGKLCIP